MLPRGLWALLLALPIALWVFAPGIAAWTRPSIHPDYRTRALAADLILHDNATTDTLAQGAWIADGLGATATGDTPRFEVPVPSGAWDRVEITVYGAPGSTWGLRLTRRALEGQDPLIASASLREALHSERPLKLTGEQIPLHDQVAPMVVRLEPRERGDTRHPQLRRVEIRASSDRYNALPIGLPDIIGLGLLPLLGAVFFRLGFGMTPQRAASGAMGITLLFGVLIAGEFGTTMRPGIAGGFAAGAALAGALNAWAVARGIGRRKVRELGLPREELLRIALVLLGVGIVLVGLFPRWEAFEAARRIALGWDASGYVQIALKGGALYATDQDFAPWVREPLFPWLLRAWMAFAPATEASARLFALLLSLGTIALVYAAGVGVFRRVHSVAGVVVGAAGALGVALGTRWVELSVQVLRLDVLTMLLMGLILVRVHAADRVWTRAAGWGLLGAALVLTRLSNLLFVVPVLVWEVFRRRWHPGEIALAAALLIVPVAPHLAFNMQYNNSGDPFYSSTVHTRFFVNHNFAGQPGFPTHEEVAADPYVGEPIRTLDYFTKYHTAGELVSGHVRGYAELLVRRPSYDMFRLLGPWVVLALVLTGGVLVLAPGEGKPRWVLVWFALALFPYAFIATKGSSWRLGAEAQVLTLWLMSYAAVEAGMRGWRKWKGMRVRDEG